jgi:hypothetical protein
MFSALPSNPDIAQSNWHFVFAPTEAAALTRSPRRPAAGVIDIRNSQFFPSGLSLAIHTNLVLDAEINDGVLKEFLLPSA